MLRLAKFLLIRSAHHTHTHHTHIDSLFFHQQFFPEVQLDCSYWTLNVCIDPNGFLWLLIFSFYLRKISSSVTRYPWLLVEQHPSHNTPLLFSLFTAPWEICLFSCVLTYITCFFLILLWNECFQHTCHTIVW